MCGNRSRGLAARRQMPTVESMGCTSVTNDQQRAHIGLPSFVRTRPYPTLETGQDGR
jgi:hypothetical protein